MKTDRFAILALLLVSFFWGTTYLALRIGVSNLPPFLFTGLRMTIAGVIMGAVFLVAGGTQNRAYTIRSVGVNALAGVMFFSLGVGMVGWAEKVIPSGLAALICSLPPVWLVLINVFILKIEKLNRVIIFGILLGLTGMIIVFHEHLADLTVASYQFAILVTVLSNISWVGATIIVKQAKTAASPIFNSSVQMLAGGLVLLLLSAIFERQLTVTWTREGVYALVYLITFGSMVAFAAYNYALARLPITLVSMHTYANVLVAIALGSLLFHEMINGLIIAAILITLAGIYFVNLGLKLNKHVA